MAPLPNYLRPHRKRSGLSQRELAHLLGCAHGSKVSRYERSVRSPSFPAILGYEIVFRKPIRVLFAGEIARIETEIRHRARQLSRTIDAKKPFTPALKRKLEFLAEVITPPRNPTS